MWRFIKGLLILIGVVALVVVGFVWWQLRSLREAMIQPEAIAIPTVEAPPPARRALVERVVAEATTDDNVVRLTGPDLTWMLDALIRRPEVRQAVDRHGARVSQSIQELPVGDFEHLKVENLDLARLKVQVQIEGEVLTLKGTVPYLNMDGHLNLQAEASGRWTGTEGQVTPRKLMVGDRDLLDGVLYGDSLKTAIEEAIRDGFQSITPAQRASSPVQAVEVKSSAVWVTVKPGAGREVALALGRLLQ